MADVFISYKREDKAFAQALADNLRSEFSVFFDADVPVGDSWDQYIERELLAAGAVVVLWSSRSVGSRWVRLEARNALQRGVLVPVLLEPCAVPLEFEDIQAAVLTEVRGAELGKLADRIRRLCRAVCDGSRQEIFPTTPPQPRFSDGDAYTNYLNYGCSLCEALSELLSGTWDDEVQIQVDRKMSELKRAVGMIAGAADSSDEDMMENVRERIWEAANLLGKGRVINHQKTSEAKDLIDDAASDICWLIGYRSRFQQDEESED